jgi:hypothetical protein
MSLTFNKSVIILSLTQGVNYRLKIRVGSNRSRSFKVSWPMLKTQKINSQRLRGGLGFSQLQLDKRHTNLTRTSSLMSPWLRPRATRMRCQWMHRDRKKSYTNIERPRIVHQKRHAMQIAYRIPLSAPIASLIQNRLSMETTCWLSILRE